MISWIAGSAAVALVATIAVIAAGFDARETPREEPSVWAMRASGQYARVNTLTNEIDTVRSVDDPSGLVQLGSLGVLLTHGNGRAWSIDPTLPVDFSDASAEAEKDAADTGIAPAAAADDDGGQEEGTAMRTPGGTRDTVAAGGAVVFRTEDGSVYLATPTERPDASPTLGDPVEIDPHAEDAPGADQDAEDDEGGDTPGFEASAVAIDDEGRVALFSADERQVYWYDAARGRFVGEPSPVPDGVAAAGAQLAIVAGDWVLLDTEAGEIWREGSDEPVALDLQGSPLLQASSTPEAGAEVLVADGGGLWSVAEEAERVTAFEGVPARPIQQGSERFAAWLGSGEGRLWSSEGGDVSLEVDPATKVPSDPELTFRSSGSSAVLSEVESGMLWTLPDGVMIPVSQWTLNDPPKEREGAVVVNDVTEQEPPVAVDDEFGVRAGEPAPLPVLLNDFDPNRRDVLTIVPEGIGEGVPESFGEVTMLADGQSLVVEPAPDAKGSASFSYRVTDGSLTSKKATVRLTVAPKSRNSAPDWCKVEGCQREWPSPEVTPGGTLVLPVLEGWVDAEGDPMVLQRVQTVNADDPVRAIVTVDGRLAMRHTDANAPDSDVALRVTVADSRGAETDRELRVQIRSGAQADLPPTAASARVGVTASLKPLSRIVGGSGSFALVDATVRRGSAKVSVNAGAGALEVTAEKPGVTTVTVTARDTVTEAEITGTLRVTATKATERLGLPPLTAFVRPLADTTVDVLDAIPGAAHRGAVTRSADVIDGDLRADVIEHASVRVSGSTEDGNPGRIGAVDLVIAEGDMSEQGRLTVFQVADGGNGGAIAVADSATVRAGSVVDVRVLDNDVSPSGERLMLHPDVTGSGEKGELAFASGNTLRYLAPKTPGNYTLSYTTFSSGSPETTDVGQVFVRVLPAGSNRDPQPRTLTARLAPGERVSVPVPLSGVDPDGDRVRLIGVVPSEDPQVSATVASRAAALQVEAGSNAETGVRDLRYTVRDAYGGSAEGRLRVIITPADERGAAPVTYSDYVRLAQGASEPATVRPAENDLDPAGGRLEITKVVPNVPGGRDSPEYRALEARLDTSQLSQGRVRVSADGEPGTVSYRYTVRSTESRSTATGLIVVQVSARVGQQAPTVQDTVLTVRDRADLATGVDVVTGRVAWASGDVASLKLSLWGSAADRFSAKGNTISGPYRAEGDLVPFKLSGKDHTGDEVSTYGFLVIPALDELRLTLKPGLAPVSVDEGESVDVRLTDIVDLAPTDEAEFQLGAFPKQRGQAVCEAVDSRTVRYAAGSGGPWRDSCVISVKLVEQGAWTELALPVTIVPDEPQAQLRPLTRTITPGEAEEINLLDMVQWQGGREGDVSRLSFSAMGGGTFETTIAGSTATVAVPPAAVPGSQDSVTVSVSGAGNSQATLTLRAGPVPRDQPRGGTISLSCNVGSNCRAQAIGAPGQYDPLARAGNGSKLKLESVSAGSCSVASFAVSGESVNVGWPDGSKGPGGACNATFTVSDAQGRTGTGTIELDAKGVPRPPSGVTPVSAGASSVTLSVALSGASSYPAVSGVELVSDGRSVGSCSLAGGQASCTVRGLTPGEKKTYTARAVNAAGASDESANGAETWAYRPPAPPSIGDPEPVEWGDNHDQHKGRVKIPIGSTSAADRVLTINGNETPIAANGIYEVGDGDVKARVMSVDRRSMLPPGYTGEDAGKGDVATARGTAIGAPRAGSATLRLSGGRSTDWHISTHDWSANGGGELRFTYAIDRYSGSRDHGGGLEEHRTYDASVSATTPYGRTGTVRTNSETAGKALDPPELTYRVNKNATNADLSLTYQAGDIDFPSTSNREYEVRGSYGPGNARGAEARQCAPGRVNCSDWAVVEPAGVEPLTLSMQSCVPWNGTDLPDNATIATHMAAPIGELGGTPRYEGRASDLSIAVIWDGEERGTGYLTEGLCKPTPPEPPAPEEP